MKYVVDIQTVDATGKIKQWSVEFDSLLGAVSYHKATVLSLTEDVGVTVSETRLRTVNDVAWEKETRPPDTEWDTVGPPPELVTDLKKVSGSPRELQYLNEFQMVTLKPDGEFKPREIFVQLGTLEQKATLKKQFDEYYKQMNLQMVFSGILVTAIANKLNVPDPTDDQVDTPTVVEKKS